jgi:hypothetical protein
MINTDKITKVTILVETLGDNYTFAFEEPRTIDVHMDEYVNEYYDLHPACDYTITINQAKGMQMTQLTPEQINEDVIAAMLNGE